MGLPVGVGVCCTRPYRVGQQTVGPTRQILLAGVLGRRPTVKAYAQIMTWYSRVVAATVAVCNNASSLYIIML